MDTIEIQRVIAFMLLFVFKSASADAGDVIAILLGVFLGIFGIFACIGCYARRRNN